MCRGGAVRLRNMVDRSEIRYAKSGDVSIAYQVIGDGPRDLIFVPGIISHVEFFHELPGYTEFLEGLASFARVVVLDKRGNGLSDRVVGAASLEERMDDIRAVMDAVDSERATLFGVSEGGPFLPLDDFVNLLISGTAIVAGAAGKDQRTQKQPDQTPGGSFPFCAGRGKGISLLHG